MAWTVSAAFDEFYERINLSGDHRSTANKRRDHILDLLAKKFTIQEAFTSGSIPRFTALREHSDVDIIVALHYGYHIKGKSPAEVLQSVRDALGQYKTNVRKNGQAVTLYYDSWPNVDVVPSAQFTDSWGAITHYEIPDASKGAWIKTKPKVHTTNVDARSATCGPSFRKIIKMVKWWNTNHSEYLQSYHIEVMALRAFNSLLTDMPWDVRTFFESAKELARTSLSYEGGVVDDYLDYFSRSEAIKRLETAYSTALTAWYATHGNTPDHKTAIAEWRQLFGDKFPAYG